MKLQISPTLELPVDIATESQGILAKKGAGKSNAAAVTFEELYDADVACVVVDPKGDWWGVRSSADGKGPGIPVPVFGGKHGDFPLEPGAGALMADIVLGDEDRGYLSSVLDVSQFTITEQRKFLQAFGERLFRQKDEERVLHLILEEAHEYLPQNVPRESTLLVSTWQRIVKQGRFKGLGVTLISQRSAALNKDVLTQVDSLIVLRTLSPQDRDTVKKWLEVHVGMSEVINSLHTLKDGEAWLWSPDRFDDPVRFRFRMRRTFDSGATPKVGQVRRAPATLANIDQADIKEQMAETIERAERSDPKRLQRRITELEGQLRQAMATEPAVETEYVEVPTVPVEVVERAQALGDQLDKIRESIVGVFAEAQCSWGDLVELLERPPQWKWTPERTNSGTKEGSKEGSKAVPKSVPSQVSALIGGDVSVDIDKGARGLLEVLVRRYPVDMTRAQLATLAGRSTRSSSFNPHVNQLIRAGLAEQRDKRVRATDQGIWQMGGDMPVPMTTDEIVAMWRKALPPSAERMLEVLVAIHPEGLGRNQLAEQAGISLTSSGLGAAISTLKRNGLLEAVDGCYVAAGALFP